MSLLSSNARHVALVQKSLAAGALRAASQPAKAAPKERKAAQSIGGVKKGRKEKWETKKKQEKIHKTKDIPRFTRMAETKLMMPKTFQRPATLPEAFKAGSGHVLELPLFGRETLVPRNVGKAVSYSDAPNNAAKVFGLPRKMFFEYRILSSPCSVVRDVTLQAVETLEKAKASSSLDSRIVLHGRAGCGKSFLLHQAVQYAQAEGWVVFYVPRAASLVNSTTTFAYDLRTQTYLQPHASYRTLDKLLKANSALFAKLPMKKALVTEKLNVPAGTTLADLVQIALKDRSAGNSAVVLDALTSELQAQTQFPVLLAVDDFQALLQDSSYKDHFLRPIKANHLSLPRLILDFASGKRTFAKGAVVTALTNSDTNFNVPLEIQDALDLPRAHPVSPYQRRDGDVQGYVHGLTGFKLPDRMSSDEMAGLFSVWKDDMALTTDKYDELFLSKYVESDGNPRDFVWKGLLSTFST
ncbi:mitochondrial carrier protein [Ephemerocybe angulata]|uniref:Small ribosomal subunit protein mS29 n=1 Tax=Ephemerocybe angulata TaxID=980116 RepID=A0A8H6MB63_9AGAR|nr:mitochondrial carrier protein [Tulosesus angulatus]